MMKGSSAARKRTTTGGSGSDNTSSSSAAAAAEEGYYCAEEDFITPPGLAGDGGDDNDDDISLEHDKIPRPILTGGNFLLMLLCHPITFWRHHVRRRQRRRRGWKNYTRSEKCILLCWVLVATVLLVDRVIFVVRYVTMGRPAFLYGSPMEWDNVKGCLSTSWRQEVANYVKVAAESAKMAASTTNHPNDHVPLNTNLKWTWHQQASSSSSSSQNGDAAADDATDGNDINTTTNRVARRRLLIAQYSGFGSYSQILNEVAPVNQAYAEAWGHDYVTLEGTALRFPGLRYNNNGDDDGDDTQDDEEKDDSNDNDVEDDRGEVVDDNAAVLAASCPNLENGYEAQSTFNKIPLLLEALEHAASPTAQTDATAKIGGGSHAYYDQVLILDTDTMIVDFDYDITKLLLHNNNDDGEEYFMAAYRVWWMDWHWTWDINAGITLWNLNHPTTRQVAHIWLQRALTHPHDVLLKNDDQFFLQRALMSVGWWKRMWYGVRTVRKEMEYYDATLIKHFKRDARSWTRTSLEQRLLRIQEAKAAVCERWSIECRSIDNLSGDSN